MHLDCRCDPLRVLVQICLLSGFKVTFVMRMIMVRSTSNPRSVDSQTERGTFKSTCALTCLKSLSISCSHRVKEPPFVSELERVRRVVPRSPLALSFCDCGVLSPSVEPSENWSVGSGSCIGSPSVDAGLSVCSAPAPLASPAVLLASASSPGSSSSDFLSGHSAAVPLRLLAVPVGLLGSLYHIFL